MRNRSNIRLPNARVILGVAGVSACALSLGACASAGKALGISKTAPDEFRVVAKAPLVVPPDYALRPPAPGEPRPQELQPESQARAALMGQAAAIDRSQGETLLASKAGATKADPLIRYVVDDEFGDVAHKDKSFADRVMFWRKGQPRTTSEAVTAASTPAPVDPAAEEAKLKSLTGDQPVVISRGKSGGIKLPGL